MRVVEGASDLSAFNQYIIVMRGLQGNNGVTVQPPFLCR